MTRTALLLLVIAACSKKSTSEGEGSQKPSASKATESTSTPAAPEAVAPVTPSAPELAAAASPYAAEFPAFDMTAAAKKLQGTWVFKGNFDKFQVWSIEGTNVTQIDGDGKETRGALVIDSPCKVVLQAGDTGWPYSYVFAGDTLHIGLGDAGLTVGKTTYVCSSSTLLRKTGDTCDMPEGNESSNGKMKYLWKTTECAMDASQFSGKDLFGHNVKLEVTGSILWDSMMKEGIAIKVASLEEGKAKQAELAAKK